MGQFEIFPDLAGGYAADALMLLAPGLAWVVLALRQLRPAVAESSVQPANLSQDNFATPDRR